MPRRPQPRQQFSRPWDVGVRLPPSYDQELDRRRRLPWTALVEPVLALCQSRLPATWNLYLPMSGGEFPSDLEVTWELSDEAGQSLHTAVLGSELSMVESRSFGGDAYGRAVLPLPRVLGLGYYDLHVQVSSSRFQRQGRMLLIIAPDQVYIPEALKKERLWGINLPLYAVSSSTNWGIGDCGDLQRLLALGGKLKAGIIGLNPLHHLGVHLHDSISPYYPTSRCYPSPLYLDLNLVPEMSVCPEAREYLARPEIQEQMAVLRQGRQVNYPEVAKLKFTVLAKLLDAIRKKPWLAQLTSNRARPGFCRLSGTAGRVFAVTLPPFWLCRSIGRLKARLT